VQCGGVSVRGESRIYGNRERLKRSGRTGRILIVYEPLSLAFEILRSRCGGMRFGGMRLRAWLGTGKYCAIRVR